MGRASIVSLVIVGLSCAPAPRPSAPVADRAEPEVELVILGTAQDGGLPHVGCHAAACERARRDPAFRRLVVSLGLIDRVAGRRFLVEATPDLPLQLDRLDSIEPPPAPPPGERASPIDGVLLTHGHVGHYAGLIHFGREIASTRALPLHGTPRMIAFLRGAGPWSQLFDLGQVEPHEHAPEEPFALTERITVTPIAVPHRDEFTDTVAYRIEGPHRRVLFVPDIDRWDRWDRDVAAEVASVDVALLDATFYSASEVPGRDAAEIPHPLVPDTMARLAEHVRATRIVFIHLNHTSPLVDPDSPESADVRARGFEVAVDGARIPL